MSDENVYTLTQLQHAETGEGPWRLYIYGKDGRHSGGSWFRKGEIKYPGEEISFDEARDREHYATKAGLEVRITDGGDMLVFHSQNKKVVYGENFWKEANGNERE